MPFQMPEIRQSNALQMVGQIRQQRTQNALADRQLGLSEAAGQRQQQQFEAEQANAQRTQLVETTKNVLGALSRVPQAQRQAAFAQLSGDLPPEFAQRMAGNPDAFTDQNIALALNRFGSLTPDQIFSDKRRETEATTAPKVLMTRGADGLPVNRAFNVFGRELAAGVADSPDAAALLADERVRSEAAKARGLTREGWDRADARAREAAGGGASGTAGAAAANNPALKTEGGRLAAGFLSRMLESEQNIQRMVLQGYDGTSAGTTLMGMSNVTASPETQLYRQAANEWIRAKLRKESGASISPDEMEREFETYFPVYGDSPQVIEQKRRARETAMSAMGTASGVDLGTPRAPRSQPTRRGAVVKWSDLP